MYMFQLYLTINLDSVHIHAHAHTQTHILISKHLFINPDTTGNADCVHGTYHKHNA